jgi:capsular exopolysaccharide synthesis family protein
MIDGDREIAELSARLAKAQDLFESESKHVRSLARKGLADPALQRLRADYRAAQTALANRRAKLRPLVIRQLQEQGSSEQATQVDDNEQELAYLNVLAHSLEDEVKTLSQGNQSLTADTLAMEELQEEVAQVRDAAQKVSAEVEALNVELEAPPRIRSIEEAIPPLTRDDKRRYMLIGLITLGSLFGGLFGVAFFELMNQKVDCADDVPNELGLRIVGSLPILPSKYSRRLPASRGHNYEHWQALLLESIDATRTMLVHAAKSESRRVVMVASAVGSEGKTSLAGHLATSLARSGLRTLLVDADLRRPAIHRVFDLPCVAGLSELLRGEVGVSDVIHDTAIEELKVVTAGRCDQHTIRVLTQGALTSLFAVFKEQFDLVIVDSSPLLPVADALIVAQQADAVLFSIFSDHSRKTKVAAAIERLECLGVRILGAVVTGGEGGLYGSYYGYDSSYTYTRLPAAAADSQDSRA